MKLEEVKKILGREFSYNGDFIIEVIEKLNIRKDAKILDIGTGHGVMAICLAVSGYHVITGEPEGDNWADWRSSAKKVLVEDIITFKYFKAEGLPFANAEFDAIFIYTSFHHIDEKVKAFKECVRVIKKDGIIIIFELTPEGIEEVRKSYPSHPDAVDPRDYAKELPLTEEIIEHGNMNAYIFKKK
jgi:ubiquinone/menaquinone biosynthesis C-methylase UbiE